LTPTAEHPCSGFLTAVRRIGSGVTGPRPRGVLQGLARPRVQREPARRGLPRTAPGRQLHPAGVRWHQKGIRTGVRIQASFPTFPSSSECPRPARGYLATTAQVHRLAAHYAHTPARLDPVSAQAAARHPATAHPRPGGDSPPPPEGGGPADPGLPDLDGWAAGEADADDPDVARLLAVFANAGPAGLTVAELWWLSSGRRLGCMTCSPTCSRPARSSVLAQAGTATPSIPRAGEPSCSNARRGHLRGIPLQRVTDVEALQHRRIPRNSAEPSTHVATVDHGILRNVPCGPMKGTPITGLIA
jgi:hypothetical protein